MKRALIAEAKRKRKVDKFFCVKNSINVVPLQMAKQMEIESLDEIGRFHHRDDISQTALKEPVGDIVLDDMFNKAREHAKGLASNNRNLTEKERKRETDLHGNLIGVVGQAGIGKTTLTKHILKKILNEKLFKVKYVFYLQFREIDYNQETNLLSFLAKSLSLSWMKDLKRRDAVLKELSKRNDVIIIMDGFDEAIIDSISASIPTTNLLDIAKPEVFIKNILRGTILGNAKKLITSRPRQLLEIVAELRPKYILNILGLGIEEQYQICEDICEDNADQVFNYIQQQPSIATYCYVPCNCILVMHAIHNIKDLQLRQKRKVSLPNTITDIFAIVLCLFVISPHVRDRDTPPDILLQKLAHLAWEGFKDKKFTFTETDLKSANLSKDELNLFFVTTFAKNALTFVGGSTKISYFSHLLIQEFLAALYLLYFTSLQTFKRLILGKSVGKIKFSKPKYSLSEGSWEMVTKFLYGICSAETQARLKDTFSKLESTVSAKVNILCQSALDHIPSSSTPGNSYFQQIIPVCTWVHEMKNDTLASEIAKSLKKTVMINGKVLPSDAASFFYVISHRTKAIKLDCGQYDTWFVGDSLNHFLNAVEDYELVTVSLKLYTEQLFCAPSGV